MGYDGDVDIPLYDCGGSLMKTSKLVRMLQQKLQGQRGETIVETLVSVLISALSLLLLATAIGTSVRLVLVSRTKMEDHYEAESSLVSSTETKSGTISSDDITLGFSDIDVRFYESDDGEKIAFYEKAGGA